MAQGLIQYIPDILKIEKRLIESKGYDIDKIKENPERIKDISDKFPFLFEWQPENDLSGMGGVYNSLNLNLFSYAHQNTIEV